MGLLPHILEPEHERDLRDKIGRIYQHQPEALRRIIIGDLKRRQEDNEGVFTSKDANTVFWRNYRLKIPQIKELFGVDSIPKVVDLRLRKGEDEYRLSYKATG